MLSDFLRSSYRFALVELGRREWLSSTRFRSNAIRGFHSSEKAGHLRLAVERAVVIERVTAVQHPTVAGVDSDAVMAAGMAGHRDEDYPFRDLIEFLAAATPGHFSPSALCSTIFGLCAHSAGRKRIYPLGGAKPESSQPHCSCSSRRWSHRR